MSDRIAVMNDGQILQVGAPDEIYNAPKERFVADFIGESNFLDVEIINKTDGEIPSATIDFPGCKRPLNVLLPSSKKQDKTATVFIRPENVILSAKLDGALTTGVLKNKIFFGTDTNFHVALENQVNIVVRAQNSLSSDFQPQVGERLGIFFNEAALKMLVD